MTRVLWCRAGRRWSSYAAAVLFCVVVGASEEAERLARSPITNGAEWKSGRPVSLPGAVRPPVESVFLYQPSNAWTYSHHPSLAVFKGRFYAAWSNGRTNEDDCGQRVLWCSGDSFHAWSEPRQLAAPGRDEQGRERVLTAAGFHVSGDTLVAYFGDYGIGKESTRLMAATTLDGERWSAAREVGLPVNPNQGPQRLPSGRLIICGNTSFPWSDDPSGLAGWRLSGIFPSEWAGSFKDDPVSFWQVARKQAWRGSLCEGSFFQTDDGVVHMMLRNAGRDMGGRLWVTESPDEGESWSAPRETEFSDTNAKFHFGRLPDGRFYSVGNPVGVGRTPLALSLSLDGVTFDRHYVLGDKPYAMKRAGVSKGGQYGYPHTLAHEGFLYVIVSRQKEAVEVLRIALRELGGRGAAP